MAYQSIPTGPWLKGIVASNQPLAQPKGAIARGSNLLLSKRGALITCDGSAVINAFNGAVQANSGRFMATFLYEPTGVNPYYLAIKQATDIPLGYPYNISASYNSGGLLPAGTYYYKITTVDGVGGESTAVNETFVTIPANYSVTLTWNAVPNAYGYNIYRGSSSGTEVLMVGVGLPVLQPNPLTGTVSFTDNIVNATPTYALTSWSRSSGGGRFTVEFLTSTTNFVQAGQQAVVSGTGIDGTYTITTKRGNYELLVLGLGHPTNVSGTGGTLQGGGTSPPLIDTTQQTALFQMPNGSIPVSYNDGNIVALFPASLGTLGQVPSGGSGGSGTTGGGISGQGSSTPSGGIAGLVGPLPQFKQFTNQVAIALGNGYAPQIFSDATGTIVNPAFIGAITSVSVTGDQVTVTTTAPISASNMPIGSNVILLLTDSSYDGVFQVVSANYGAKTFVVRNTGASGGAATGSLTVTTTPIVSTFVPAYPVWTAATAYAVGDIIVPATQPTPNIYLTAVQAGVSGSSEPSWTSIIGNEFSDGSALWQATALLNSSAPPPPGAGHIEIYAGSLWVFNTSPTNTANGLDGPCSLRMSNTNNMNAWNPVNQAFLDKDDGAEGMGMGKFTITAQGIPPEGSLIAFKYRVPYQIIGVFGATNFAIQPVSSDMGCLAPRTIVFVPGFGLMRYCHLGIAVFNGYKDEVVSEQIRPYLFPLNDFDIQDIAVADSNYLPLSWSAQTANPPMYVMAAPIGNSGGKLTRGFCFDLILKAWMIADFPFALGCIAQVQPVTSNPLTLLGGFSDGCLQRWQAGDFVWYSGILSIPVAWSTRINTMSSQDSGQRVYARRTTLVGAATTGGGNSITVVERSAGIQVASQTYAIAPNADFELFTDINVIGLRFDAIISGNVRMDFHGLSWQIEPRPMGVPAVAI